MAGQNINQFAQTQVQGQMDLQFHGSVLSGQIDNSVVALLVAGQAVKLSSVAGAPPQFLPLAANTDPIFGFLSRNLKDANFTGNSNVEVAFSESVMIMTASAAITRGAKLEYDNVAVKVKASAGVNPLIGIALDSATADGDLIRVFIKTPLLGSQNAPLQIANVTATLAQINAGLVAIPGIAGQSITVVGFTERVVGAFATGTSVNLQSDATGVIVEASAEAGLTNGAVLTSAPTANVAFGAGFGAPLPAGEGLKIVNIGAAQTVGTSIQFTITYKQA